MSEQASLNLWTKQIRLEGYKVVSERRDTPSDPVRLTLVAVSKIALCPHCSRPSDSVHRRTDSDPIRDLPHGVQAVELIIRSARLKELVEQRESFRAIFEDTTIKEAAEGERHLRGWMERTLAVGLKGLEVFCKTLGNWMGKIANYFIWRSSNGRTEGFNHGLRAILWRAFGMTNFRHFRLRVLDRFGSPRKS